jgi:hypothetical protein
MAKQTAYSNRNWSTPLIIGTSIFTGISGVMLFLHLGEGLVKEAHEWIGIAFVFGTLLHIKVNWAAFRRYFSLGLPRAVMASVLVGSLALMLTSGHGKDGNPMRAAIKTIEAAPLSLVAQLQSRDADELHQLLETEGFKVANNSTPLLTIASDSGKSGRELFTLLFGQHNPRSL